MPILSNVGGFLGDMCFLSVSVSTFSRLTLAGWSANVSCRFYKYGFLTLYYVFIHLSSVTYGEGRIQFAFKYFNMRKRSSLIG